MINDFIKKFITNTADIDNYGLKYNYNFSEDIKKVLDQDSISILSNKVLIKCNGEDTRNFLNTQFTNDIKILETNTGVLCGYCNPKGRLISIFYIFQLDKDFYLYTTLDTVRPLLKKLKMYKMMSKVEFEVSKDILIGVSSYKNINLIEKIQLKINEAKKINNFILFKISDNQTIISTDEEGLNFLMNENQSNLLGYKSWDYLDIKDHIPFITESQIESFTPQMISLDVLNGVSFTKGCYPGQEIVARTHYLGEAKKSLYELKINSKEALPDSHTIIDADNDKQAGDIINLSRISDDSYLCLAVLRKEMEDKKLTINHNTKIHIIEGISK